MRIAKQTLWKISLVLAVLGLPLFVTTTYARHLLIVAMLYGVVASNWDLTLGYAGVFNFAHIAFFALGAYSAGILSRVYGISPFLNIPIGAITSVLASIISCVPVLRVKGTYVCLVTFAFSQVCLHVVMSQSTYTGGSQGIVSLPPFEIADYSFLRDARIAYYYLALLFLVGSTVFLTKLVRSNFGLSIVALRDAEDLAVSRGVPLARQRLLVFIASAAFTGAAGAFYAHYLGVVSPELFGWGFTVIVLSMVLLGGIGTLYGPILGAFVLTFVSEFMLYLGPWRFLIISAMIVMILRFYPDGVLGAVKALSRKNAWKKSEPARAEHG